MSRLETDDPIKSQLLQKAHGHRQELEGEVKELTDRTEKVLTNIVLVGGALALTYFLVRGFSGSKKKRNKVKKKSVGVPIQNEESDDSLEQPSLAASMLSQIGTTIANEATALLLDVAKQKLAEYLESQAERKRDVHTE